MRSYGTVLMKEYHTDIVINTAVEKVWETLVDFSAYPAWNPLVGWLRGDFKTGGQIKMFIKPLNHSFQATLTRVEQNKELTWVGIQFAAWWISGEHYYRLEKLSRDATRVLHGEYFRGLGSVFIGKSMLTKMLEAFKLHNLLLKERVENG
jgi:hypothetical protein